MANEQRSADRDWRRELPRPGRSVAVFLGMKRMGLAVTAAVLLSGCASGPFIRPDPVHVVEPEGAAALLSDHPETFILDVSSPDDFEDAHLARAFNIPRSQLWFRMYDVPSPLGQLVLVCDARGERSMSAALMVRDEGYFRVYELKGGVSAWMRAGLPAQTATAEGPQ